MTCRSQLRLYSKLPVLQNAVVTLSFDDATNSTLEELHEALPPWLRMPSHEVKLFDIILDHNSPEIQAQRVQNIAKNMVKFDISEVNSRLECPNFLIRVTRRTDWNRYYDNLYEQFKRSLLVPSNHLPRGPDIEFLCNIAEHDKVEFSTRLERQFPRGINFGAVKMLNIYKDHDGKRQKSSFYVGAKRSILDDSNPFAWGLPIPIPIPTGAIGGAAAGSAMEGSLEGSSKVIDEGTGDGSGDGGDGGGSVVEGISDGFDITDIF
ncbi:predicted protein [Sclerotinia sclerotiorum 1980 UF-70]|uniref:Uncharacterized protein n=2 Tax=Sclerotinia sclerotiorum (strain ATCC 18683 / 1980 / Ss-1) TaxID=665079 RepID=A7E854_SCLS1|nr:predicted protein [Sclerotinia sclerotiorum 1980 UF-70]APA06086.1 hypothetical protein sscle_01g008560 [Sclerotinia sclerotiorum 1980 UF-70]EDN96556.1 predicted protein [Sclerotinia sclerotiorum 1980 UF-70]